MIVVIEMVFAGHFSNHPNLIKNNKIPEYAKNYRKEYLFIRGINKEFKYLLNHINEATSGYLKVIELIESKS